MSYQTAAIPRICGIEPAHEQGIAEMYRSLALCLALCLASAVTGCKAPSEPQDAATAVGGMMPSADTTPEMRYIADQSDVKVLPERTISTEPLSAFREKLEAKRAEKSAMTATSEPASGKSMAGDAADKTKAEEKSLWGDVKSLFGNKSKAKPAEKPTASPDDSKNSKKDDDSGWGDDDDSGSKDKDKENSNDNDSDW